MPQGNRTMQHAFPMPKDSLQLLFASPYKRSRLL